MSQFSICIITYNEEKTIQRCLSSLEKLSDDIVVVDSGSTDTTVDVARRFPNVRVVENPWPGFSKQRNFAASQAKYDWIFWLDADEMASPRLQERLQHFTPPADLDAYRVPRRDIFYGKWIRHGDWYPQYHLNLYNKKTLSWDESLLVHEKLTPQGDSDMKVETLQEPLLHFSHLTINHTLNGFRNYTTLDAYERSRSVWYRSYCIIFLSMLYHTSRQFWGRFLFKKGFLDGWHGFYIALMMAQYELFIHVKLFTLRYYVRHKKKMQKLEEEYGLDHSFYKKMD